jgi:probable F420-dependent oxidoreductase
MSEPCKLTHCRRTRRLACTGAPGHTRSALDAPVAFSQAGKEGRKERAMRVGLFLPLAGDAAATAEYLAAAATAAEKVGFHSLWFAEHVVLVDEPTSRYPYSERGRFPIQGESGLLEPFAAIAFAAALTKRIRLGTGICLVPQRPPIYTAKQVADCDVLSRGRLDFGVGIGWLREEFDALGASFDDRAERCRDHLAAMRSLWTDSVSSYDGATLRIPAVRMFPKPIQKPHPPIVFGGESDAALRRVADLGQGWYGFNLLPDEAARRIDVLTHMLSRRGRRPAEVEMSVCPYLKPGRDAEALRAYAEAGVDQVIHLVSAPTPAAVRSEIETLGQALVPAARQLATRPRPDH